MFGFDIEKQKFTIKTNNDDKNAIVIEREGETRNEFSMGELLKSKSGTENNLLQLQDLVKTTTEELEKGRKKIKMIEEIEKLPKDEITAIGAFISRLMLLDSVDTQIKETEEAIAENDKLIKKVELDTGVSFE